MLRSCYLFSPVCSVPAVSLTFICFLRISVLFVILCFSRKISRVLIYTHTLVILYLSINFFIVIHICFLCHFLHSEPLSLSSSFPLSLFCPKSLTVIGSFNKLKQMQPFVICREKYARCCPPNHHVTRSPNETNHRSTRLTT